jgi:serine/threonine-protein kinase
VKTCTTCGAEWPDDTKFCPNDGSTLRSADASADLVGSVIADRYHIEKKLGEGGMGAVYLGEHVKMGRKSAIKVMTQAMANDPEAIARFNREAANAARINHPNVCAIYDFGETSEGVIYLAMEFIEGEALSDLLRREGALAPQRATSILRQTADALQSAHDLGIVHRDLKPDNIMITKGRGNADVVKVVDFGIAKAMTGEEGQKVTKTGLVVGTPEYMSPEQLSGDVLDGRSDLYSLALVYFRMLTGSLPFQADSAQETMIKRLTDDPMRLLEAQPNIDFPSRLQEVLDKALERMPGDRYENASVFADDAEGALSGMAAPSGAGVDTDGATQLIDAQATEQIAATRVSGGAPPGAPAAPPAGTAETRTPTTPAPIASPAGEAPRKKPVVAIAASVGVVAVGGIAAVIALGGGGEATGAGDDTTAPPGVTTDTARPTQTSDPVRTDPGRESTQQQDPGRETTVPTEQTDPGPTRTDPPPPAVDMAAITTQLDAFNEATDEDTATEADRNEIEAIYRNGDVSATLRSRAAFLIGVWEVFNGEMSEACLWYQRALDRDSNNSEAQRALSATCQ